MLNALADRGDPAARDEVLAILNFQRDVILLYIRAEMLHDGEVEALLIPRHHLGG